MHRRADLGEFLRARRDALAPEDVGLPRGARRRARGLRREEVALLAGVSVSWYTWLEQGRPINPSLDVLDALARVLRLDPVEHAHLVALAGHPGRRPPATGDGGRPAPASLLQVLALVEPAPAYLLDSRWDFLAWNAPMAALYPSLTRLGPGERNLVWAVFADPEARTLVGDWEGEARRVLSQFRAETLPLRDDPALRALVARLMEASAEFAAWWPRHDVAGFETHRRVFEHARAGRLVFEQQQLVAAGAPDLRLVVHVPVAGDDSVTRLAAVS